MDDDRVRTDETVRLTGETAQFIGEKYKLLHRSTAGVKPCENCTVSSVNRSDMTSHVINCAGKLKVCGPLKTNLLQAVQNRALRLIRGYFYKRS